jgi:trk system potassium uptake protein TrkA
MKQIAIMGLGYFGKSILDELLSLNVEVFIIDKDRATIDTYKDASANSVVLDILTVENLRKILPESLDAVIIDMGDSIEASILATSYCAKLKIKTIIVKAESEALGEILELVGATKVVFPNKEAAKRVTPLLFSSTMLNYMPVSGSLSIAELSIPEYMIGKTLLESELREKHRLNLVSVRDPEGEFVFCGIDYVFKTGDIGLFSGNDADLNRFAAFNPKENRYKVFTQAAEAVTDKFLKLFRFKKS